MNGRRQRIAWVILLAGFVSCVGIIVLIPVGLSGFIQRATRALDLLVQANAGTVGVLQGNGDTFALFAGELPLELDPATAILTNEPDSALLLVNSPNDGHLVSRIQVYGNTNVVIESAETPRFNTSSSPHRVNLILNSGRLQVVVPRIESRPIESRVVVPQGEISLDGAGVYSIATSNVETQIAVLEGEVSIYSNGNRDRRKLTTDQRGVLLASGEIEGPLESERNLLANGNFAADMSDWVKLAPNIEIAGQPTVETDVHQTDTGPTLIFKRTGIGHADDGLRQIINQDVTDFESLILLVNMRVREQSLGVCGQQGSECPLIVRIEYVDINGVDQIWQQGFFAQGEVGPDTPDVCVACPPPLNLHQRVPFDQLYFYESENLLAKLEQLGIVPRQIKSINLIASGHSFHTEINDIALLAQE